MLRSFAGFSGSAPRPHTAWPGRPGDQQQQPAVAGVGDDTGFARPATAVAPTRAHSSDQSGRPATGSAATPSQNDTRRELLHTSWQRRSAAPIPSTELPRRWASLTNGDPVGRRPGTTTTDHGPGPNRAGWGRRARRRAAAIRDPPPRRAPPGCAPGPAPTTQTAGAALLHQGAEGVAIVGVERAACEWRPRRMPCSPASAGRRSRPTRRVRRDPVIVGTHEGPQHPPRRTDQGWPDPETSGMPCRTAEHRLTCGAPRTVCHLRHGRNASGTDRRGRSSNVGRDSRLTA